MKNFQKFTYEEVYRFYEFKRPDDKDGLASDETITSHAVTCEEKVSGTDCTAAMISNTSVIDGTKVAYMLKAGTAGTAYYVIIKVVTSTGQKLEGKVTIDVR